MSANDPVVIAAQAQLQPLFAALLAQLDTDGAAYEMSFFTSALVTLQSAQEPMDIAELFVSLSTVAFVGFQFTAPQAALVDALLAEAEQMAHALSADDDLAH